jgi:hypothetical protein
MVIVPVTPLGTGLLPVDAAGTKPFGPTDAPGTIPNEDVTPSEGVTVPTWANAGPAHSKGQAVAAINNGLTSISPTRAEGLRSARPHAPQ